MNFDGIDDELLGTNYPIPSNSNFTIEFWFKMCEDTALIPQVFLGNSDNLEIAVMTMVPFGAINTYELCARYGSNNHVCHQDQQFQFDGQWHHIAVTYIKILDQFNIFYDGLDGTLSNYPYNYSPFSSITLGVSTYQATFKRHYKGYMDELRISNTVRYSSAFTPPTGPFTTDASTTRLWHFDEQNPISTITDYSGNGLNLTPSGNPHTVHLNNLISQSGGSLIADNNYESYQWINCATGDSIIGATQYSYTPMASGNYAVMVSNSSCTLTSNCYNINTTGIVKQESQTLKVYPNPADDLVFIHNPLSQNISIELYNQQGESLQIISNGHQQNSINISNLSAGIYYLKLFTKEQVKIEKIVKQ